MPPHATTSVLPILRHIGYLPLVMGDTPRRVLSQVHKYPLRMRGNPLTVHIDFATNVD